MNCTATYLPSHKPSKTDKTYILLWMPTYGYASVEQPAKTYKHQFCVHTGYCLEDLPGAMDDKDIWQEKKLRNSMLSTPHDLMIYIYIYIVASKTKGQNFKT